MVMAGSFYRDGSIDQAARELRRRLLSDEKQKWAEEREIERLKASGWTPRIETRPIQSGPGLSDAARAIEAMENQKEAYRLEAQRRLAERAGGFINAKYQGQPSQGSLDDIQRQFETVEQALRMRGFKSADALHRYLENTGADMYFTPKELRRYPAVQEAEKGMQRHFLDWMIAPKVGQTMTPKGVVTTESPWDRISADLLNLKEGETTIRRSDWDRKLRYPSTLEDFREWWDDNFSPDADLYGFAGEAALRSNGGFRFTRHGDTIDFDGKVLHKFEEPYDFEKWTVFPAPGASAREMPYFLFGGDGSRLAEEGRAKPFLMISRWPQRVMGTLRIDPAGKLIVDHIDWRDIPSHHTPH
jgi:hypothetical protein